METADILQAVVLCFIIVLAFTGNLSLWIIICKSRELRTVTNMFILGLSAADLLVSVVNMPITVCAVIAGQWPFSTISCKVLGFFNMLTLVTSVMSLCNISINRFFMVCRPYKFIHIYSKRNAVFMLMGVVTVSLLLSLPPLFGWGEYSYIYEQSICFCRWTLGYAIFMIICCFGGPFSVMTVSNIFIYRAVRASRRRISQIAMSEASGTRRRTRTSRTSESSSSVDDNSRRRSLTETVEQRLAMSLMVVVVIFVICWLPYCISMIIFVSNVQSIPREFHMFTITLGYANSCCNPLIYGLMNTQFAKGFKDLYCYCRRSE